MPITKSRQIAKILKLDGNVKDSLYDSDAIVTSARLGVTPAAGTAVYSSADTLPASADNGDQALVSSTNRFYIFTNSGWYNIALINTTPYWITEANSSYELNTTGTATTITMLAQDSEGINIVYTATADSDFNQIATVTKDSDNGRVFTIIPTDSENGTAVGGTGTITFRASDGVNLVSTLSSFSIEFQVTNSNYTVLLLKADSDGTDNQVDASTSNRTITENGNITSTAFSPYHPAGYSTYFDGTSNSQILIQGESTLAVGTGDFSFSCWYKSDGALDGRVLASSIATTSTTQLYWNASVRSDGAVWFQTRSTANSGLQKWGKSATGLVTANTWHHITISRQSGWHYVAVDGVQDTSVYRDQASFNLTAQELAVGASNITGYQAYNKGYIRDLNFCVGGVEYDLSVGDGNVAYTVPDEPISAHANTKVLLANRPYIKDTSASPLTIDTIGSAVKTVRVGPYDYLSYSKADHGGSVYFDGTDDNLSLASSADFNFGSSDWTIEAWLYQTARDGSNVCRWYMSGANGGGNAIHVSINTNGTLDCGRAIGGGVITGTSTAVMPLNTWNHVVATKEGSNGYLYLNGKQVSTSGSATEQTSGDISLRIGYDTVNTVNEQFTGYMSDLQVIKGRRKYKAAFTPPTLPMTADSDAVLFTCTNKNDIWDAARGQLVVKTNQATASNTQRKFTTSSSMYFDGTTDHVHVDWDETNNLVNTTPFTIEGWFYFNVVNTDQHFIQAYENGSGYDGFALALGANSNPGTTLCFWDGAAWRTFKSDMAINTWYHIAVVNDATASNNTKIYVDGTQSGSAFTVSSQVSRSNTVPISVGCYYNSTQAMNGYAQDVRITKGLARYTSNFTPPTSEFKG